MSEFSPADDNLLATLMLGMVAGVGPRIRQLLLERFGSPEAVLAASPAELRQVQGVGAKLAEAIVAGRDEAPAREEIEHCRANGLEFLTPAHDAYPRLLNEIPDPPGVLFCRGELRPEDAVAIAIVGTRHATGYGLKQAARLAGSLSQAGMTIVSGMARGIDAAAHRAALAAGGRTVAVLAGGLSNIYPPEHAGLADEVAASGVLLSEAPSWAQPLPGTFPQRNRIITGMSLGVIVVEAADRSGALISARHAMEQGREVFAVPGRADSRASRGCHRLLRDGARLVESADDVLEELGPLVEAAPRSGGGELRHPAELKLNEQERCVLDAVGDEPTSLDTVAATSGLPVPRVLSTISVLEMRHLVRRVSGNLVVRR